MSTIDLNNPPPNYHYNLSVAGEETPAELYVRLGKEVVVFSLAAVFVCVIYWLAFNTAINPAAQVDEKKWALSVLSAGAAGLVGYLLRK